MAEQKTKPATKKVATAKAGSAVVSKSKTAIKPAAKKPAAKKTMTKKSVSAGKQAATPVSKKKAPVMKPAGKKAATTMAKPATTQKTAAKPTPEERYRMVETTAYFIAERNGFQGDSTEHWVEAEREIAAKLDW